MLTPGSSASGAPEKDTLWPSISAPAPTPSTERANRSSASVWTTRDLSWFARPEPSPSPQAAGAVMRRLQRGSARPWHSHIAVVASLVCVSGVSKRPSPRTAGPTSHSLGPGPACLPPCDASRPPTACAGACRREVSCSRRWELSPATDARRPAFPGSTATVRATVRVTALSIASLCCFRPGETRRIGWMGAKIRRIDPLFWSTYGRTSTGKVITGSNRKPSDLHATWHPISLFLRCQLSEKRGGEREGTE